MAAIIRPFIALYSAMLFMAMSLGLLSTFLSLRLTVEGFSPRVTGLILTSYFIGSVVGTLSCGRLIKSVGYIRSFAAFAAVFTAMVMLHGCVISAVAWAVFRFFSGIAVFGLFMVIESWLNECSQSNTRGKVFSIYMVMNYLGAGIGQQLLNIGDVRDQTLFFVVGFLIVSCILPVALTRSIHPQIAETEPMALKSIIKKAPMGLLGCFTSGFLISSFYTMGPVFGHHISLSVSQISAFMTITVLGGLVIQWPIGAISDKFDRSIVIPSIAVILALVSGLVVLTAQGSFSLFLAATCLFGGFIFCIYPVAVARAHDLFDSKDVVNVSSALLLFYGIGSVIGPVGASAAIELFDTPYALYGYISAACILSAVVSLVLRHKEMAQIIPVADQVDFIIMDHTSQVALQIDPRSETDDALEGSGIS